MSLPILSIEPAVITAGDTITWSRSLPDYPASGGWVLHYALRGPVAIDVTAAAGIGSEHLVTITALISASYTDGVYTVQGYVTNGTSRVTIYSGQIIIQPDLVQAAAGYDGRSHVKRVLDSIEAVIEGRASKGDQQITIDGTTLVKMTATELLDLRTRYNVEYRKEQQVARIAQGKNSGRKIVTRFTR
jgi:hypothetical protein